MLRSLHRYAADAFVLVMLLHLVREWLLGRYHGFRRFSWLTGVPLIWFVYTSGIGGFWIIWDQLGQFSAIATAEWLDWLPLLRRRRWRATSSPPARSATASSRCFVFVHLGMPLLLLFGLWFHIQRITRADGVPAARAGAGHARHAARAGAGLRR